MPAEITSIEVRGNNSNNNKVKRSRRYTNEMEAKDRFKPPLKPNLVKIRGNNLNLLNEREIAITYDSNGDDHKFAVLEVKHISSEEINVYFVVWKNEGQVDVESLGNLTVTVETVQVTPTNESGTEQNVTIEDN